MYDNFFRRKVLERVFDEIENLDLQHLHAYAHYKQESVDKVLVISIECFGETIQEEQHPKIWEGRINGNGYTFKFLFERAMENHFEIHTDIIKDEMRKLGTLR